MDIIVEGATIVTCDATDTVIEGDVLVQDGAIAALGKVRRRGVCEVVDGRGMAVIPGFVQAHVHLCQTIMRGMADDMPLLTWLRERIWPLESVHDEASLRASAELGLLEMSLSGTTAILDMGTVRGHDAVMDVCAKSGMRVAGGKAMMDLGDGVPKGLRETTRSSLDESERLAKTWHGAAGRRMSYAYAPRFILSCSEALVRGACERAEADGSLVHTHASEHPEEREAVRDIYGAEDTTILRKWGMHGPRAVLAHGVQLTDSEIRAIAHDGTRIVHCPTANLKLGSGIAPIARFDHAGIVVGLGADGAPCNNNLDPWMEMRHAALLAKIRTGVTTVAARRALRLATLDGARVLGRSGLFGSLEVGKRADLVLVRVDGPHVEPGGDVFSRLVYGCGARDVSHVMVDGKWLVKGGEHMLYDSEAVRARARKEARKLAFRAGLSCFDSK